MPTHNPRCAYGVLYRCTRCGRLRLSRETLERAECPAGDDTVGQNG